MNPTYHPAHPYNYDRGRLDEDVSRIVLHLMAGTMAGTAAWFANPLSRVSAHYGVAISGEVHQYVPEEDTAWHAGDAKVNRRSIGIEHEGDHPAGGDWRPGRIQWEASVRLAADICRRHGIEPSEATIVLHSQVSSSKPRCPGPGFNLSAYVSAVRAALTPVVEEPAVTHDQVPVRLFDPVANAPIGEGTLITNTDKVYVKRLGPIGGQAVVKAGAAAPEEDAMKLKKTIQDLWDSGWLGKAVIGIIGGALVVLLVLMLTGRAFAQAAQPELLDPSTWFGSVEAVLVIAGVIAGYVTKLTTALGKDWFHTNGKATVVLSAVIAAIVGGIGGYLALGAFAGSGGIPGMVAAVGSALIAFLGSNASAKADRQALAGAVSRIESLEAERAKARLL